MKEEITASPSQEKAERAREVATAFYEHIKHGDDKHRAWLKEECDGKLFDLITQALCESEAFTACSNQRFDTVTESSGQGTDGAEAMREAAAKHCDDVSAECSYEARRSNPYTEGFSDGADECALRIRALPVSAEGSVDNTCGCVLCDFDLIPRDFRNHVTRAGAVYPCTNRKLLALKSKQPSDTGAVK